MLISEHNEQHMGSAGMGYFISPTIRQFRLLIKFYLLILNSLQSCFRNVL